MSKKMIVMIIGMFLLYPVSYLFQEQQFKDCINFQTYLNHPITFTTTYSSSYVFFVVSISWFLILTLFNKSNYFSQKYKTSITK